MLPAVNRHRQTDQRQMPDEGERDTEQEQLTAMARCELDDLVRGSVLGQGIVAKNPLVEVAEKDDGQHRPQQRYEPQRQRDRQKQHEDE